MTAALPGTVVITRPRHPLAGRELRVLGGMRRHGRLELLLVLPDGSKRLIPAEWTSQHAAAGRLTAAQVTTRARGRWGRWLTCWLRLCWFRRFPPVTGRSGSRLHESHRPRRTIVQPVQLSLLPDQVPAPPPDLIAQLPGPQVTAAITAAGRPDRPGAASRG